MKQQPWGRVVAALEMLGCKQVGTQTLYDLVLCRGAAKIHRIRKLSPVPVSAQRNILRVLDFDEEEYLAVLDALDNPN